MNNTILSILITLVIITLTGVVLYRYLSKKYQESLNNKKEHNLLVNDISNKLEEEEKSKALSSTEGSAEASPASALVKNQDLIREVMEEMKDYHKSCPLPHQRKNN